MRSSEKLHKLFRYISTGYIFKRKEIIEKLKCKSECYLDEVGWSGKPPRIAVYTIIIGSYDTIKPITVQRENIDYYLITDQNIRKSKGWKIIHIKDDAYMNGLNNIEKSRFYKIHPELLFRDYEYSLYVDGNISVLRDVNPIFTNMEHAKKSIGMYYHPTRDCIYDEGKAIYALGRASATEIKHQLSRYKNEGMPKKYGLYENNIIARKHTDMSCKKVMETWWDEFISESKRDQLSFMYALWKNGHDKDFVMPIGNNSRNNEFFEIVNHK